MTNLAASILRPILNISPIRRVRRNHGLEHATIHILSRRVKQNMAGRAVLDGFYVYGDLQTEDILDAAQEAIDRMRGGEHMLAVHPNCGTGLVTSGIFTSLATLLATVGGRNFLSRLSRFPLMITVSMLALIISQPTGLALQQYVTTMGDPGNLEIVDITRHQINMPFSDKTLVIHRVWTIYG